MALSAAFAQSSLLLSVTSPLNGTHRPVRVRNAAWMRPDCARRRGTPHDQSGEKFQGTELYSWLLGQVCQQLALVVDCWASVHLQYLLFYQIALLAACAELSCLKEFSSLFNFNLCVIRFKVYCQSVQAIWCPTSPQLTTATTSFLCPAEAEHYRRSCDLWSG